MKCRRVLRSIDEGTYVEPSKETLGIFIFRWSTDYALHLQQGEILAQRWQDIDFETESLLVSPSLEQTRKGGLKFKIPKNGKRRCITMPPLLIEALEHIERNRTRIVSCLWKEL